MTTPKQIAALAQEVYNTAAPTMQIHNLCQIGGSILLAIAAARGVDARLCFDPNYRRSGPHFFVMLGDGTALDMTPDRKFRVLAPGSATCAAGAVGKLRV